MKPEKLSRRARQFLADTASGAMDLLEGTGARTLALATSLVLTAEQLKLFSPQQAAMMRETGAYLHDVRQVAGLTLSDLAEALDLKDQSLLQAVENGTATLSFELILRLTALLARHDPVPFGIRLIRTYQPELWQYLERWGIGRLPGQYERERLFMNILRSRDQARELDDEAFRRVLAFTEAAFVMALEFARSPVKDHDIGSE